MIYITKIIEGSRVGTKAIVAVIDPTTLDTLPLSATDNGDGTAKLQVDASVSIDSVDIGDVDIKELPSGNLGQQVKAASLSVAPATDISDATYIGDIKFGESAPLDVSYSTGATDAKTIRVKLSSEDLVVIENIVTDLGSPVHLSGNASSQSVPIPTGSRAFFASSTGGISNFSINSEATVSTSPLVYQNGYLTYPISDSDLLYCYASVGTDTYINFLG